MDVVALGRSGNYQSDYLEPNLLRRFCLSIFLPLNVALSMCQVIAAFFFFYREDRAETAALYFVGKNQSFNGEFIELHLRVKMRTDLQNFKFRKKNYFKFFYEILKAIFVRS